MVNASIQKKNIMIIMMDKYRNYHIERLIKATNNLYLERDSICKKCHICNGDLNCALCYCPLYDETDCGGDYTILDNGLKDCSKCLKPHQKEFIIEQLTKLYNE